MAEVRALNEEYFRAAGDRRKYHVLTFGCQMNEHDSEVLAGMAEAMGFVPTDDPAAASLIIVNTCCIRESAERKIYGKINALKPLKKANQEMIIAVGGCMVQQEGAISKLRRTTPHVDILFGPHNEAEFPHLVHQVLVTRKPVIAVVEREGDIVEGVPHTRRDKLKAWVAITYGCNNFCSYCIVPYVRGRERSRRPEDICQEVRSLSEAGIKEITLLGQNVNSYGRGLPGAVDFADLLGMVDDIPGIERIRYLTSHPRDFSDKLIATIAGARKVCEHFHLPVQAGSDRILRLMNRGYTRDDYLTLVKKIRRQIPAGSLTTDIIVGFPGETETDFADTLDLVERVGYDTAYTFIYSRRSGTKAAEMKEQVSPDIKKERLQRLMALQNQISLAKNRAEIGKIAEILVEGESPNNPTRLTGRTRTNKIVLFPRDGATADWVGKIVPVQIKEAKTWTLYGKKM
ncbi:MAG: tRNA (N6-isopentenyl adenosine(37)-C2)-methylthiotransferase MiaB [bacterium]